MSKKLNCPMCGETCRAETEEEIMEIAEEHVENDHPDIELDEETIQTVKDNIQDV